ncbi:MAG: DNA polymerase III subunit alpha, partial [Nitrospinota bacterium]
SGGTDTDDVSHHLVLLVKNLKGYRNLCKMVSASYTEGFYYKPRIDKELLNEHNEGLIALSACLKGEVARKIMQDKDDEAETAVGFYKELFGDRYYLEVQDHGIAEQRKVNRAVVELSKKYGIKLVATNDCHYLKKEHAAAHEALLCIQTGKLLSDSDRMKFPSEEFYFKSEEEMRRLFAEIPEAVTNTREVAERCNLDLHIGEYHLPKFSAVPADSTPQGYLESLVDHNLGLRLASMEKEGEKEGEKGGEKGGAGLSHETATAYKERTAHELEIIKKMNFAGYFLIVWDFIQYARKNGIPVGPGRGSAAGSLVAYCLEITDVDPLKYGLLFERFLNPARISMPDIDIDFCIEGRDEVIKYVSEKYGAKNVAQIITFGTMKARAAIRDVGRVMGVSYAEVDQMAKLVPDMPGITIDEAVRMEKKFAEIQRKNPKVKELLDTARVLEGLTRHASTHAAGVVIAPSELTDFMPLYKPPNKEEIITQYSMNDIEKLGLLKMDFLGLKTLTVIDWTEKKIRASKNGDADADFSIKSIPMDDKKTYELLSRADTLGIFQLESSGMRDILRKLKPEAFTDIIALVALYRPGPLGSGMIDSFIKRKHGTEKIEMIVPQMKEILNETYGVIVYQEQVMKLANVLGGFTMAQADELRKAMGKKKPEIMAAQRERFMEGARKNKIDERKAQAVFTLMDKFGGYGFNKSHSTAYALLSYRTAYLKAHYRLEYMASLLTSEMENTDKIVLCLNECREKGIKILPPDINGSGLDFTVSGDGITFGLAAVKNVGQGAVHEILRARDADGDFKSLVDFAKRVDMRLVNRRVFEALIKCGAFDTLHDNLRHSLFESLNNVLGEAARTQDETQVGQANMFANVESDEDRVKSLIADVPMWSEHERLQYEKDTLGFYITGHPLAQHQADIKRLATVQTSDLREASNRQEVQVCGIVTHLRRQMTKKKEAMAYVMLEDLSGVAKLIVWPDTLEKSAHLLEGGDPVFVKGRIDADENEVRVIVAEIFSLNEAKEKFTSAIHLNLNMIGLEEPTLMELLKIAKKHKGPSSLILHFTFPNRRGRVSVSASDSYRVAASEPFISAVENVLGPNSIYCS